jgi:ribosomal protein L16 Arg81 hydroxylase
MLVRLLEANGVSQSTAQSEVAAIEGHPYLQGADNLLQLARKQESILGVQRDLLALSQESTQIARRKKVTREEFLEDFYSRNRPVLLTQMMKHWRALAVWTPEYLKEKLGEIEVEVQTGREADPLFERNLEQHRERMQFSRYADMVTAAGETNDFYMVANNKNFDRQAPMRALFDDIEMFPALMDREGWQDKVFLWFGPKGTITPLHHDPMNVILCQVRGRKKVWLISPQQTPFMYNYTGVFSEVDFLKPDLARYPLYQHVRPLEFILEPGQAVFIPVGWWHAVVSLDLSLSVSMTNFAFPNRFHWQDPQLVR